MLASFEKKLCSVPPLAAKQSNEESVGLEGGFNPRKRVVGLEGRFKP